MNELSTTMHTLAWRVYRFLLPSVLLVIAVEKEAQEKSLASCGVQKDQELSAIVNA